MSVSSSIESISWINPSPGMWTLQVVARATMVAPTTPSGAIWALSDKKIKLQRRVSSGNYTDLTLEQTPNPVSGSPNVYEATFSAIPESQAPQNCFIQAWARAVWTTAGLQESDDSTDQQVPTHTVFVEGTALKKTASKGTKKKSAKKTAKTKN